MGHPTLVPVSPGGFFSFPPFCRLFLFPLLPLHQVGFLRIRAEKAVPTCSRRPVRFHPAGAGSCHGGIANRLLVTLPSAPSTSAGMVLGKVTGRDNEVALANGTAEQQPSQPLGSWPSTHTPFRAHFPSGMLLTVPPLSIFL